MTGRFGNVTERFGDRDRCSGAGAALGASIAFVLIVLQQFAAQKNNAFSVVRIKTATITKSES